MEEIAGHFQSRRSGAQPPRMRSRLLAPVWCRSRTLLAQQEAIDSWQAAWTASGRAASACPGRGTATERVAEERARRAELDARAAGGPPAPGRSSGGEPALKGEMDELKARIDRSKAAKAPIARCAASRSARLSELSLIDELDEPGHEQMGDRFRLNQALLKEFDQTGATTLEAADRRAGSGRSRAARLSQRLAQLDADAARMDSAEPPGQARAPAPGRADRPLENESYAPEGAPACCRQLMRS